MKTILCVLGYSGSGKTLFSEYLCKKYNYNFIQSYTDRARRTPDEVGHTFVTKKEFSKFKKKDMIAFTKFGENRYCCLHEDVKDGTNVYVIDESGLNYLIDNFSEQYKIISIWVYRDLKLRQKTVNPERIARDEGMFTKGRKYDHTIYNSEDLDYLYYQSDELIKEMIKYGEI